MKNIYETITSHQSIRKYKDQDIPQEDLKKILDAVVYAPTSVNGQQSSVVVIKDSETKKKLAELTGNQPWVAQAPVFLVFVADFSRVAKALEKTGVEFKNIESVESTLVGAVDCGIAFGSAMNMAESLGYGIVPIGAIRKDPQQMIDLLGLPKYVYPVVGMCIGVPDENPGMKPRFGYDVVVHEEKYHPFTDEQLQEYDNVILDYMDKRTGGKDIRSWSDSVSAVYGRVYFPDVKPTLESQGFKNEK